MPKRESGSIDPTGQGSMARLRLPQLPAVRSSDLYTSISPIVQLLTATACRTPKCLATACSNCSTNLPFVSRPVEMISS